MLTINQISIIDSSICTILPNIDLLDLSGKRLFLTGGTGFFGLWLLSTLKVLRSQGIDVQTTVLSRDPSLFLNRCPQFKSHSWLNFIEGNIKSFTFPKQEFDLLVHAATETSIEAHANYEKMLEDMYIGTRQVLNLAESNSIKRILLTSSGAVYGPQPQNITHIPDESLVACNSLSPSSAYGEGKRLMELMGAILQHKTGIECISARCFAFSGPGLPTKNNYAIANFIHDALYEEQILVKGDGSPTRSYLFGADLSVWLLKMLLHGKGGKSYNVGSDEAISIKDLAFRVRDLLAPNKKVQILDNNKFKSIATNHYVPEIKHAKDIGCSQWTNLNQSITLTSEFLKNKKI